MVSQRTKIHSIHFDQVTGTVIPSQPLWVVGVWVDGEEHGHERRDVLYIEVSQRTTMTTIDPDLANRRRPLTRIQAEAEGWKFDSEHIYREPILLASDLYSFGGGELWSGEERFGLTSNCSYFMFPANGNDFEKQIEEVVSQMKGTKKSESK